MVVLKPGDLCWTPKGVLVRVTRTDYKVRPEDDPRVLVIAVDVLASFSAWDMDKLTYIPPEFHKMIINRS